DLATLSLHLPYFSSNPSILIKAAEEPTKEETEQVSVGGTVTKVTIGAEALESPNEGEKDAARSGTLVAEPAGDAPAQARAERVEPLKAELETEEKADGDSEEATGKVHYVGERKRKRKRREAKTSEETSQQDEGADVEMTEGSNQRGSTEEPMEIDINKIPEEQKTSRKKKKQPPTRMSQRILRSRPQKEKAEVSDDNCEDKNYSAGREPGKKDDDDGESRTVQKRKKKLGSISTPLSSMERIKMDEQKEEEVIYRIYWEALEELKIREEVEAYLTNSNMMELINPREGIDTEHTKMFYSSVEEHS
ncbi:hypothetical protein M569_17446, partial [Genlisea aurea]